MDWRDRSTPLSQVPPHLGRMDLIAGRIDEIVDGFLNLDKPAGLTSHDCVARLRRSLRQKRIGHAGTLDPAATGVLPMAVGRTTRLLQFLPQDKAYQAVVRFGLQTATDDLEGEVLHTAPCPELTLEAVQAVLPQFLGSIEQIPPKYSAIQVDGQRLYDRARAGETVDVPVRTVTVYSVEVLGWKAGDYPELTLAIACGPGTYIRAIARDLGHQVKTGATLAQLIRTHSSGFDLSASLTLEAIAEQVQAETLQPITATQVLAHLPAITLGAEEARRWCLGQRLLWAAADTALEQPLRVLGEDDTLLGVGRVRCPDGDRILSPWVVLAN